MSKELTNSMVERQNVLNNPFAVTEIQKAIHIRGVVFEETVRLVREQIAAFLEVDVRTIERYIKKYGEKLGLNGYEVLQGKRFTLPYCSFSF